MQIFTQSIYPFCFCNGDDNCLDIVTLFPYTKIKLTRAYYHMKMVNLCQDFVLFLNRYYRSLLTYNKYLYIDMWLCNFYPVLITTFNFQAVKIASSTAQKTKDITVSVNEKVGENILSYLHSQTFLACFFDRLLSAQCMKFCEVFYNLSLFHYLFVS